jgi:hypothetical protein
LIEIFDGDAMTPMKTTETMTREEAIAVLTRLRAEHGPIRSAATDALTLALSALSEQEGWRPIESAPKDERGCILVWLADEGFATLACWRRRIGNGLHGWLLPTFGIWQDDENGPMHTMTHWTPLPAPPKPTGEGE